MKGNMMRQLYYQLIDETINSFLAARRKELLELGIPPEDIDRVELGVRAEIESLNLRNLSLPELRILGEKLQKTNNN